MYFFDTNVFSTLGYYYRSQFPTIWGRLDALVTEGNLYSVREVLRELERYNASADINSWIKSNKRIFLMPTDAEIRIVTEIMNNTEYRSLVARKKIRKGDPVADPFLIAASKSRNGLLVTQEKDEGMRIPRVCRDLNVRCINLEVFLNIEGLKF